MHRRNVFADIFVVVGGAVFVVAVVVVHFDIEDVEADQGDGVVEAAVEPGVGGGGPEVEVGTEGDVDEGSGRCNQVHTEIVDGQASNHRRSVVRSDCPIEVRSLPQKLEGNFEFGQPTLGLATMVASSVGESKEPSAGRGRGDGEEYSRESNEG